MIPYTATIKAIKKQAGKISLNYPKGGDGRLSSAVKGLEYISIFTDGLKKSNPTFAVYQPQPRHWYDIMINGIPINLKLTTGSSDNAFNKQRLCTR
jgi:hypothetical protein